MNEPTLGWINAAFGTMGGADTGNCTALLSKYWLRTYRLCDSVAKNKKAQQQQQLQDSIRLWRESRE